MKKITALLFLCIITLNSFAGKQDIGGQYFIVGARGTFNSTWLYNKNQFNDKGIKYKPSWGGSGGIMFGLHYIRWGSVNVEALYSSFSQKLSSGIDTIAWTSRTNLAYWEFPVLLHFDYNNEKFKYIEAGIKFSSMYSASVQPALPNYDIKKNFEKQNISAVFGWGAAFIGQGGMLINLGIRLTYGLSDIITNAGGKGKDYLPLADGMNAQPKPYTPTNIATIGFHLSIDYDLGWFLYSGCHRKYKFFLF